MQEFRFPNESDEYRSARNELLQAELQLRREEERIAALRRELPPGGRATTDYKFDEVDLETGTERTTTLSQLFEPGKDALFLYSFMIVSQEQGLPFVGPCPSCTSIIDGIDGQLPHITQHINFAVVTKAPIERFRQHAETRGWRHARLLSAANNTYQRDYGAEDEDGFQWPLATVFEKHDDEIRHFWSSELWFAPRDEGQNSRHVEFMWPMWNISDRTRAGRWDSIPSLSYD
jgi:predicted dithiol-disulfide oxidoreductase (DUF899 family)